MSARRAVSRREFIKVTAVAGGGVLLTISLPGCRPGRRSAQRTPPSAYLRIDADGTVTILAPKIEMGQGTFTALPMIVADELDADWARVRVEPAPLDENTYGWQGAGGSTSVWTSWQRLRTAGAAARQMLRDAAANAWGVTPESCRTERGRVIHDATKRSVEYGAVAAAAADMRPPAAPVLKSPSDFRIIGTPMPQVGLDAIVTGRTSYGCDTRAEGGDLRRVVVERGPLGARPVAVRDDAARGVAGVRDVVRLDKGADGSILAEGVAVVADSTWAALQGRRALEVDWSESSEPSTDDLRRRLRDLVTRPGKIVRDDGDCDQALRAAANTVEAEYELPFLAHAPMEPGNCFVQISADRALVRGPFQDPAEAKRIAVRLTGLPANAVTVQSARLGGGFGRRLESDYAAEAVALALKVKAPIQIVWTREDDIRFDLYRPAAVHRLAAGLDASGRVSAWRHRQASTSRYAFGAPSRPPESSEFYRDDPPAGMVPNYRLEYTPVDSLVPRGAWRSVIHSGNAFVVGCFLDEVAEAAGQDSLAFRLGLFGPDREIPYADHGGPVFSTARLKGVLQLAADRAGWPKASGAGRALGIAGHFTFGSYCAQVAEVSVDADGVRVHRVVAAIDCGQPVNPAGIRAQVIGGIVFALTAALHGEITVKDGRVVQGNFHDYPMLRIDRAPQVEVHIVPSTVPPTGTGETAGPPIAPAVANALYRLTGTRVRRLPIRL